MDIDSNKTLKFTNHGEMMWKKHKTSKLYLDSADSLWWFMLAVMKVVG